MKSVTPMRRKSGQISAQIQSPQIMSEREQPYHAKTLKIDDQLQLNTEENYQDTEDQKTCMQSPGSSNIQKQSLMGSSGTSFFRSPNPRTNYKGSLAFKNDIATSEDLNNRDNNSNIDEMDEQF